MTPRNQRGSCGCLDCEGILGPRRAARRRDLSRAARLQTVQRHQRLSTTIRRSVPTVRSSRVARTCPSWTEGGGQGPQPGGGSGGGHVHSRRLRSRSRMRSWWSRRLPTFCRLRRPPPLPTFWQGRGQPRRQRKRCTDPYSPPHRGLDPEKHTTWNS